MATDDLGVPGMTLLTRCLGKMGATPEASRFASSQEPASDDPAERYFR
jgi:hypothetical protein